VSALIEDLAVRGRKELLEDGWDAGPISVQQWLRSQGMDPPSRATLARIFTRRGLVTPQPQKRPRSSWRRFQFELVHECWQLDATETRLADGGRAVVFQLIDDRSRYALASVAANGETGEAAVAVVRQAMLRHRPPLLLLSDNGMAVNGSRRGRRTALETTLIDLGVRPICSSPYHPQTCGKNERIHATLKRWLRARPAAATLAELQTLIETFDTHYNHQRGHQALAGHTPADVLATATHAPLPIPPEHPTAPPRPPTRRLVQAKVAANGNVGIGGKIIQIGADHRRHTVIGALDGTTIRVYDQRGDLIREITTTAGQRYYPLGRRTKCPH
jgi:transposase InsO family protein